MLAVVGDGAVAVQLFHRLADVPVPRLAKQRPVHLYGAVHDPKIAVLIQQPTNVPGELTRPAGAVAELVLVEVKRWWGRILEQRPLSGAFLLRGYAGSHLIDAGGVDGLLPVPPGQAE